MSGTQDIGDICQTWWRALTAGNSGRARIEVAQLRRALAQVGHQADVAALARDLYWWNDDTRARWCFDYYGAGDAAPDAATEPADKPIEKTIEETGA